MTIYQFALYRYAYQQMQPEERVLARKLARRADVGDEAALEGFMELVNRALKEALARPAGFQKEVVK